MNIEEARKQIRKAKELNLTKLNLYDFVKERLDNEDLKKLIGEIKELTSLQSLDLFGNQISDISSLSKLTSLQYLELSRNQISDISSLSVLTSLQFLDLRGNQALEDKIPEEILNDVDNPQKILNYYASITEKKTKPLNEAKIVVVGEADFGKTLLIRRLIYDDYIDTKSTMGIKIEKWKDVSVNN